MHRRPCELHGADLIGIVVQSQSTGCLTQIMAPQTLGVMRRVADAVGNSGVVLFPLTARVSNRLKESVSTTAQAGQFQFLPLY
jgi:hypothetical protein